MSRGKHTFRASNQFWVANSAREGSRWAVTRPDKRYQTLYQCGHGWSCPHLCTRGNASLLKWSWREAAAGKRGSGTWRVLGGVSLHLASHPIVLRWLASKASPGRGSLRLSGRSPRRKLHEGATTIEARDVGGRVGSGCPAGRGGTLLYALPASVPSKGVAERVAVPQERDGRGQFCGGS